jgi:exopolysaccharide biosynthesis predicted pyruvyltransferase EpsI
MSTLEKIKVFQYRGKGLDKNMVFNDKKDKKFAVMWASTNNIGDDIQTLAGINFLKKKGITEYTFIDREKLSDYNGEPVTLIMNGWYMHNINKFPPSNKINPIFISVHINNEKIISNNISYFKKYEPIGCRDQFSVNLFKKYNIASYFTGCLTLLFDDVKEKTGGKYLVDVNTKYNYIPNIEVDNSKYNDFEIIKHDINKIMPLKERLVLAENLLNKYRSAKLVITTRLHCILPCRAFNTNAIFIHKQYETDARFSNLKNIMNGSTTLHTKEHGNKDEIKNIRNKFLNIKI